MGHGKEQDGERDRGYKNKVQVLEIRENKVRELRKEDAFKSSARHARELAPEEIKFRKNMDYWAEGWMQGKAVRTYQEEQEERRLQAISIAEAQHRSAAPSIKQESA